jgi:hypothetical protein
MKKILAAALMILSAFALTVSGTVPADAKAKKHHSKSSKAKSSDADKSAEKPADGSAPAQ